MPVPYGQSDIDFLATHPRDALLAMHDGTHSESGLTVETKGEHNFDPFGNVFHQEIASLGPEGWIPTGTTGVTFSMLREQHHSIAPTMFGTSDFGRRFVLHAMAATTMPDVSGRLLQHRISLLPVRGMVRNFPGWNRTYPRPSRLRHTLAGDLWHRLMGYCGFALD